MSNQNKATNRLAIGTVVYMIGNLTSKMLQMLILPIITANLTTSEYGFYDLIVTTINLVTPFITLQIVEGMFRFLFEASEENKVKNISTTTAFLLGSISILGLIMLLLALTIPTIKYPFLIYLNYVSVIVFDYMQKIARVQQQNRVYAISGVVNTIIMLVCQALTLLVFKMGTDGMLIANSISYFVAAAYLEINVRVDKWLKKSGVDKGALIALLKYSAPLMPNSIVWWLVASSDRYVISCFLGMGANGIYSIAGKFSQLLTFAVTVFQLAWQENAILERNSKERDAFYTNTFNTYMKLLLGGYLVVLPLIRLLIPFLLESNYQCGYLYNPLLLFGAIMSAFAQFYGSAYLVFKKTSGAFFTTLFAAIMNLLIGVSLIRKIGLFAPALGTAMAFLLQWILRAKQMKAYFNVKIDLKTLALMMICVCLTTYAYYEESIIIHIISFVVGLAFCIFFNFRFIKSIIVKLFNKSRYMGI